MQRTIILPDLGQTTSEAKILEWLKKPGEYVERGEPLLVVETDKVNMDIEAYERGFVRELLVAEGEMATAMSSIAVLTDTADEPFSVLAEAAKPAAAEPVASAPVVAEKPKGQVLAVPGARLRARELKLDLSLVQGTGAGGLVTRADVDRFAAKQEAPVPRALAAMAATVVASKREIPHFYAVRDVSMSHAAAWRTQWNEATPETHLTFNDIFVRCASMALADVPRLNIAFDNGAYRQHTEGDILMVVARDPALLLVPLSDPSQFSWEEFRNAPREAPAPLLAVSNLGMYGLREFSAIIPPGCTSALAIGAVREEAVVRQSQIVIEKICTLTLSADHRVVDGVSAARFLERVQFHIDNL
ncbi:MAG: dihydrolipoamide acetyltransferase family protein [Bryobacteraceae bacterium]